MKGRWIVFPAGILIAITGFAWTGQEPDRPMPPRPPKEALAACESKAEGGACTVETPNGDRVTGRCRRGPRGETPLACVPSNGPGPEMGARFGSTETVPGSQVSTAGVLCSYIVSKTNKELALPSSAQWSCSATERKLTANGIPDHPAGQFPNPGNPNTIAVQNVHFTTALTPALRKGSPVPVKIAGYAINGIKFDPGTAQSCTENCGNHGEDPRGRWRIEALNQSYFDFGVDENNAHVQPDGSYHYHGVPTGLLKAAGNSGQKMTLVAWAVDGFPIYARYAYSVASNPGSAIRDLRSSYRLKSSPDAERPGIGIAPMGTFTQDYQYVAGSGDLDECNGRSGVTPEFPKSTYYYMLTESYPYVPRCVKGNPSATQEHEMPPPGMGRPSGGRLNGPPPR